MRTVLTAILVLLMSPVLAPAQTVGEVSCDKGVDITRVQALVKRTVEELKKDPSTVIREINAGDKKWKDGDYYMIVLQGTKVLAHGYIPTAVGLDAGHPPYDRLYPTIKTMNQLVAQKGEGCVRYDFMNPAKNGTYEHKVTYFKKVSDTMFAASGTNLVREKSES